MGVSRLIVLPLLAASAALGQPTAPPLLPPAQGEAIAAEVSGPRAMATVRVLSEPPPDARLRRLSRRRRSDPRPAARIRPRGGRDHLAPRRRHDLLRHPALAPGLERALGRLVGGRGSASPPGPSSRSASPRTASRDAPRPSWSTSAPARARPIIRAGRCAADSSSPPRSRVRSRISPSDGFGAAGIVSWAQNQRTAWWGEDESLVRWGHLETFSEHPTFAFMVSPARARGWQERLRRGETVRLRAEVDAGQSPERLSDPDRDHPGPAARPGDRLFLPSRPSQSRRQRQCIGLRRHPRSGAHARAA